MDKTKTTITVDLNDVKVLDLSGNVIPINLCRGVGNLIFQKTSTIEWDEIARGLHAGKPVEIEKADLEDILKVIVAPGCSFTIAVKVALRTYITDLLMKTSKP